MNKNWLLVLISALSIFFVAMIITFSRAGNYAKKRIIRHVHENALKIHGFIGIVSVHILNSELVYKLHVEGSKKGGEVSLNQLEAWRASKKRSRLFAINNFIFQESNVLARNFRKGKIEFERALKPIFN